MSSAIWGLEGSRLFPSCLVSYSLPAPFSVYQSAQSACYQCRSSDFIITKIPVNRMVRQPEGNVRKCARGNIIYLRICVFLYMASLFCV